MDDRGAVGREHGQARGDRIVGSTHDHEQLTGRCLAGFGVHGAVHDHRRSGGHRGERAVGSAQHVVHAGVVDHAHAQHVRCRLPSSARLPATLAAVSAKGSRVSGRRAQSVVAYPASTTRRAIGPP